MRYPFLPERTIKELRHRESLLTSCETLRSVDHPRSRKGAIATVEDQGPFSLDEFLLTRGDTIDSCLQAFEEKLITEFINSMETQTRKERLLEDLIRRAEHGSPSSKRSWRSATRNAKERKHQNDSKRQHIERCAQGLNHRVAQRVTRNYGGSMKFT